jgi:hypothetical protein
MAWISKFTGERLERRRGVLRAMYALPLYHLAKEGVVGTVLDAYLDVHHEAKSPHVTERWETLGVFSLGKLYGLMRALDESAEDTSCPAVTQGWPAMLAGVDEREEEELADMGTRPVVVDTAAALDELLVRAGAEGQYIAPYTLLASMRAAEANGRKVRVLFVRG